MVGSFEYAAGQRLRIASKADFFVFVDRTLALESGGFLGTGFDKCILALDTLGLTAGDTCDLHIFLVADRQAAANPHIWIEHPGCDWGRDTYPTTWTPNPANRLVGFTRGRNAVLSRPRGEA